MKKILLSAQEISNMTTQLGVKLSDHINKNSMQIPTVFCMLDGAFRFYADLVKCIGTPIKCDFIKVSSYEGMRQTQMRVHKFPKYPIVGKDIILVDDILDTGNTINFIINKFKEYSPKSITVITLIKRKDSPSLDPSIHYINGFEINNEWIAGYGMDDLEDTSRNLNYIFEVEKIKE